MRPINLYVAVPLLVGAAIVQSTLVPHISFVGAKPNLVLLVVISWSLFTGAKEGIVWGFIGGFFLDLLSGSPFGLSTLAMLLVSYLTGLQARNIFRSNITLPLATIFFATIMYDVVFLILLRLTGRPVAWGDSLIWITLPATLLNTLLMPLVYGLMLLLHRSITGREGIGW